jgi:hypothetical protein
MAVTVALDNPDVRPQSARLAIYSSASLLGASMVTLHSLDLRSGLAITSDRATVTFLFSNHADVAPVTTYWFGPSADRSLNMWAQSSSAPLYGGDTSVVFSWQNCVVPASGTLNLTFVVHSEQVSSRPVLTITSAIPSAVILPASLSLMGSVATVRFDASICLVGVINGDLTWSRSIWGTSISSASQFTIQIPQSALPPGNHSFTVYAVDSLGAVSLGYTFACNITGPTASSSVSPTVIPTPGPPPTRTISRTPIIPVPTFGPRPFPLDIYPVSGGYNFNIVGKDPTGNISTTLGNKGYRTAGWIGTTAFQLEACRTVSSSDGSIATSIDTENGTAAIDFSFTNFRSTPTTFELVVAGTLTLGEVPPRVEFWSSYGLRVRSVDRLIQWDSSAVTLPSIGDPYPDLGTVNDPGNRSQVTPDYQDMLEVGAGRLFHTVSVGPLSSVTLTITVSSRLVAPPPIVAIDALSSSLYVPGSSVLYAVEVDGQPFIYCQLAVLGYPLPGTRDRAQVRSFGTMGFYLSSVGYYSSSSYALSPSTAAPFQTGPYRLFLYAESTDGGVTLCPDFGTMDVVNLSDYRRPTPDNSAGAGGGGVNAAAIAVPIVILVVAISVGVVLWWYHRRRRLRPSDSEYAPITEASFEINFG